VRELEFLPDWYPQVRRRKRLVILQAWGTLALCVALVTWTVLARRDVAAAERTLGLVDARLADSRSELKALDELLVLDTQLGYQQEVLAQVGPHVDAARLMATLDEVMPADMAVLDLSFETEQPVQQATVTSLAGARAVQKSSAAPPRRVRVKLIGVAPTDVDIASFLTKLTAKPVFDRISMTRSKERPESGHVMREFEVTFGMELQDLIGG
jgi:hypothetical protein